MILKYSPNKINIISTDQKLCTVSNFNPFWVFSAFLLALRSLKSMATKYLSVSDDYSLRLYYRPHFNIFLLIQINRLNRNIKTFPKGIWKAI